MTTDEIIAVVSGFKAGKEVQFRLPNDSSWWGPCVNPLWNFEDYEYRLTPKPVPPGDLIWEEAEALRKEGVPLQMWIKASNAWHDRLDPYAPCWSDIAYRRTPTSPKPEPVERARQEAKAICESGDKPRMVSLGPWDIRPNDVFRFPKDPAWKWRRARPVSALECEIEGAGLTSFAFMQREGEISRDGGATWARCEKPEVES